MQRGGGRQPLTAGWCRGRGFREGWRIKKASLANLHDGGGAQLRRGMVPGRSGQCASGSRKSNLTLGHGSGCLGACGVQAGHCGWGQWPHSLGWTVGGHHIHSSIRLGVRTGGDMFREGQEKGESCERSCNTDKHDRRWTSLTLFCVRRCSTSSISPSSAFSPPPRLSAGATRTTTPL